MKSLIAAVALLAGAGVLAKSQAPELKRYMQAKKM
jgi:hypothetical protein